MEVTTAGTPWSVIYHKDDTMSGTPWVTCHTCSFFLKGRIMNVEESDSLCLAELPFCPLDEIRVGCGGTKIASPELPGSQTF